MTDLLDTCSQELMEFIPQVFQFIKLEMRRNRSADLSVPQFRALRFIQSNSASSVSLLAEHLGITLPSVSKLVDGLVKQGLVCRQEFPGDRRRLVLVLTPAGDAIVNAARSAARMSLTQALRPLSPEDLETVHRALQLLLPLFRRA